MPIFLLKILLISLFSSLISSETLYKTPINSSDSSPNPRQYHTGILFLTWNKTNMDNLCESNQCGPFCNTTNTSCLVLTGTTPQYSTRFLSKTNENYTYFPSKCSKECCNTEYCYRSLNKNGDLLEVPSEEVLLIFGGKVLSSSLNNQSCYWSFPIINCDELLDNDLWFFFIQKNKWSKIDPGPNPSGNTFTPSKRYGHKSVLIQRNLFEEASNTKVLRKYLYVYGGISADCSGACEDLWAYEIPWAAQRYYPTNVNMSFWNRGNHWKQIEFSQGPGKRAFHSMVADQENNYIYLFGGVYQNNNNYTYSNDLWRFSIMNETWEKISYCGISSIERTVKLWDGNSISGFIGINDEIFNTDNIKYTKVSALNYNNCYKGSVNFPSCRGFSTLSIDKNNNLYIFGGSTGSLNYLNDLWKITISGVHCSFEASPNFFIKDINDISIAENEIPEGLSSSTSFYQINDSSFFVFGGFNQAGTKNGFWLWKESSKLWHQQDSEIFTNAMNLSNYMPDLKGHIFLKTTKGFIIHGGVSYELITNSNISRFNQTFHTDFAINCKVFLDYGLIPSQMRSINQMIYREIYFFETNGNPCFKESPSFDTFPDQFYPNYSNYIYSYFPCDEIVDKSFGSCYFGNYYCNNGYYGKKCENILCPNSFCLYNYDTFADPYCEFCSKHGTCNNGKCLCEKGYTGENCSIVDCSNNCSDSAGVCISQFVQNQCRCDIRNRRGYDDCSIVFCLNDCGDNGVCRDGICLCNFRFNGTDCSVFNISLLDFIERIHCFIYLFLFIIGLLFTEIDF